MDVMDVTIDANDIFEQIVNQNKCLQNQIKLCKQLNEFLVNCVKCCLICQQNQDINQRLDQYESQMKLLKTNESDLMSDVNDLYGNNVDIKNCDYNDCNNNNYVKKSHKRHKLKEKSLKRPKKKSVKMITKSKSSDLSDEESDDNKDIANDPQIDDNNNDYDFMRDQLFNDSNKLQRKVMRDKLRTIDNQYKCDSCNYFHHDFYVIEGHMNEIHLKIKPYKCHICHKKFSRMAYLSHHRTNYHHLVSQRSLHSFKCQYCGLTKKRKFELRKHIETDHLKIRQICHICEKTFKNKYALNAHLKLQHISSQDLVYYPCDWKDCLFKSKTKANLKNIRQFECQWPGCDHKSRDKSNLSDHMRTHGDQRDYRCEWPGCEFACKTRQSFWGHKVSAHLEKPFNHSCHWPECSKKFSTKNRLNRHLATHTSQPNIPCPLCSKLFRAKRYLTAHLNNCHNGYRL
ncbi:zinc finger protein 567-like isoform X2 [Oppia nitens]|uniref:zinc finger protein 567-like isoform X2 n=1 Tax=Oppia nitens TaxID=1686743 RepID=UPI0023DCC5F2|nr:zinc finger protein 567-like isoform X2 [Oppia nitens]